MEQLISGKWDEDKADLLVSPSFVDASAPADALYCGKIRIGASKNLSVRGTVSADNPRIMLTEDEFSGNTREIGFKVNMKALTPGECVEGELHLITSLGEKTVSLRLRAEDREDNKLPENVRNLDDFVRLASHAYGEAYSLFGKKSFKAVLQNEPAHVRTLYEALSATPLSYQRMEEFLVSSGRKNPVCVTAEESLFSWDKLTESVKKELRLTRNTWGHFSFRIETDGDFLEVPVKQLTEEDFVGSVCELDYIVHADEMGPGRHFGEIILRSASQELRFQITASRALKKKDGRYLIKKKNHVKLAKLLISYRLEQISLKEFSIRTLAIADAVRKTAGGSVGLTLYETYVRLLSGDRTGAVRLLHSLENHDFAEDSPEIKGAFLFLCDQTSLLTPGQIDVGKKLGDWHRRRRESYLLTKLLLESEAESRLSSARQLMLWEDTYDSGSRSPLLYIEALSLMKKEPSLLRRFNGFTKTVLYYGAVRHCLTQELALRAAALADNEKVYTNRVYGLLTEAYKDYPEKSLLEAICRLVMKGNPHNPAYFRWYEAAIGSGIRMTRLYEAYMETMPATYQERFPAPVRKYFQMPNSLSSRHLAFLYANIIRHRSHDEATYRDYREKMQAFAARYLAEGAINEDYAVLYQEFFGGDREPSTLKALSGVMYTCQLICDDRRLREVIVCHPALEKEEIRPLRNGCAYVRLYSRDALILFRDAAGRRFASGISYSTRPLMETEELTGACLEAGIYEAGVLVNVCPERTDIDFDNLAACRQFSRNKAIRWEARCQMNRKLLDFYRLYAGDERLHGILEVLDPEDYEMEERKALPELMVRAGLFDRAYELTSEYGIETLPLSLLMRLVSYQTARIEFEFDPYLLTLVWYVYRHHKYNDRILRYLSAYGSGPLEELLVLRHHVREFYLESYELDERILMQAMFVRQHLAEGGDILKDYRHEGGKLKVIRSYLIFEADECVMKDKKLHDFIASLLARAYDDGKDMPLICSLALLSWYADQKELNEKQKMRIDDLMEEMRRRNLKLNFFRRLPKASLAGCGILDRIFVEERAEAEDYVILHYRLGRSGHETGEWKSEPMTAVYRGIFLREFILFYDEKLTYYITVEHEGKVRTLPEKTLQQDEVDMAGSSRYQLINQMLRMRKDGHEAELSEKLSQYRRLISQAMTLFAVEDGTEKEEGAR